MKEKVKFHLVVQVANSIYFGFKSIIVKIKFPTTLLSGLVEDSDEPPTLVGWKSNMSKVKPNPQREYDREDNGKSLGNLELEIPQS